MEAIFDTAQRSGLGLGYNILSPILAIPYSLSDQWRFEPTAKFRAALGGHYSKYRQTIVELLFNWKQAANKYWVQIDPKIEIDQVKDKTAFSLELEAGKQLGKGIGAYLRPSFPLGKYGIVDARGVERKFNWAFECGIKYVY